MTWTLIFTSALRKSDIHYLHSYSHSFVIIRFVDKRAMLFRVKGVMKLGIPDVHYIRHPSMGGASQFKAIFNSIFQIEY